MSSVSSDVGGNMNVDPPRREQGDGNDDEYAGDCDGPNSAYVRLISCDDHEFIIKRKKAMLSHTMSYALSSLRDINENESSVIHFDGVLSRSLQQFCLYFTRMSGHGRFED